MDLGLSNLPLHDIHIVPLCLRNFKYLIPRSLSPVFNVPHSQYFLLLSNFPSLMFSSCLKIAQYHESFQRFIIPILFFFHRLRFMSIPLLVSVPDVSLTIHCPQRGCRCRFLYDDGGFVHSLSTTPWAQGALTNIPASSSSIKNKSLPVICIAWYMII